MKVSIEESDDIDGRILHSPQNIRIPTFSLNFFITLKY